MTICLDRLLNSEELKGDTQETGRQISMSLRLAWSTELVPEHLELYSKTLS